ncbi:DUF7144 family membrane protein [Nocardioides sp. Iso805N]|uniref:DUF7144 family membrane protein n=1 Tax=Nocardioides sp. Iso805N TaxID=1283287 RepID=UPI00036D90A3|nr:hypothetical protein [Nocardioides sp. Iso805N]
MSTTHSGHDYDDSARGLVSTSTTIFAASMLAIVGACQILQGISAVAKDKIYVSGINYVYQFDVTTWGWIHIVVGALAIAVAVGIIANQTWGRIGGIVIGVIGAVANFMFLPYYPFWSLVLVGFNVLVIWALCVQLSSARRAY